MQIIAVQRVALNRLERLNVPRQDHYIRRAMRRSTTWVEKHLVCPAFDRLVKGEKRQLSMIEWRRERREAVRSWCGTVRTSRRRWSRDDGQLADSTNQLFFCLLLMREREQVRR